MCICQIKNYMNLINQNSKLTRATVVYLVDKDDRVCLAQMKKAIRKDKVDGGEQIEYSLGVWNGYGGKEQDSDVSIEHTAIRELEEESTVKANVEDLENCGAVNFYLIDKSEYIIDQKFDDYNVKDREVFMRVYFYILKKWQGEPIEGKEMGPPTFFKEDNIPYDNMMPADKILFERLLSGGRIDSNVILMGKDVEPIVKFML